MAIRKKSLNHKFWAVPVALFLAVFLSSNTGLLLAAPATVTTGSASNITKTTAELNGTINDNGEVTITEAGFEYGLTTSYGGSVTGTTSFGYDSQFGSAGSGNGQFSTPTYTIIDLSGNLYVSDAGNSRIQKFNSSGVYQSQFGTSGAGNGQFTATQGLAIDSGGNIYVSDNLQNRIQKFNSSGVYQSQFGTPGSGDGEFDNPLGLAIDSLDNIYVADANNHRIQKFNSSGVYQSQFGTPGSGDGEFNSPAGVDIDSSGNIYVADTANGRVQKFDSSGVYQSQFSSGTSYVVFVDSNDNVFVSDLDNHVFKEFNSSGTLIDTYGSSGTGDGQFDVPIGLAKNSLGDIFVVDSNNNRVQKFELSIINPTEITGLTCGTTYHFRAYATNADGTSYGNDNTFTTSDCEPPEVNTENATNIGATAATINGFDLVVNDISITDVDRGFEYGFTASYGQTVNETSAGLITNLGASITNGGAVDSLDNIYSLNGNSIRKFNSAAVLQFEFGSTGTGDGQFDNPNRVAIDSADNLYVVDYGNDRIQKFNSSGVYQSQFGTTGTGNGQFDRPYSLAIDSADNLYVVDYGNDRIQKFNSSGVYQSQFGVSGTGDGEINQPVGIAIDTSNNIYVADYNGSARIQKFNSSGTYISSFIVESEYDGLVSIHFDRDSGIFVAIGNNSAQKFDSSGNQLYQFLTGYPIYYYLLLDSDDDLYVGDMKLNRNFSADISSLNCGTTYHFRAFATNAEGTDYGDDTTFTTASCGGSSGGGGPGPVYGCTNSTADNYNSSATVDDGSCVIFGCTDRDASNFSPQATVNIDDYCVYDPGAIPGCTDPTAGNYDPVVTVDDGSCLYGIFGCMDATANNYNPAAQYSNGSCTYNGGPIGPTTVFGCMNSGALNFDPSASVDDGSCNFTLPIIYGCIDVSASNFDSDANTNDGSCSYIGIPGVVGEVIGGTIGVIRQVPKEILTGVSIVGLVVPGILMNILQPGLLMGIVSIPIRLWNLIPILMGYRRKKRPWGTVYDSVTKQPLDPVYVTLNDASGAEQGSSITDLDGRYGFLAEAGTYTLSAKKDNYVFPSAKLAGKSGDDLYNNLYFGGPVTLEEKEGVIFKNIPMDALNFNWNEFAKAENKKLMKFYSKRDLFFARTANTLFIAGLLSSAALFLVNISIINTIVLSLYAVILILRLFGVKPKQAGRAYDSDGTPLSFGIIRIFSAALGKEVGHTVIGKTGRYYMLLPNGQYYMKVSKKTGEDSYQEVLTTGEFGVTGGYVNRKISI